jgi:hypothetical protein
MRPLLLKATLLTVLAAGAGSPAWAAEDPLAGTWELVRVDNLMPDGHRVELYGPHPQGLLMMDGHGRYALQILREGRARFAANDKAKGTPAEYADAVNGSNTHFGRYHLTPDGKRIVFQIEHASFPNWEGTEQTRSFELDERLLTYRVPTPTSGSGAIGEVQWRRVEP